MTDNADLEIRPVRDGDREQWDHLYAGYAAFYQVPQTSEMRDKVWGWLHDPAQESEGLVAQGPGGKLVGLAHFRPYARPLAASTGLFLDDLFVSPDARGSGAADALIEGVRKIAEARGCSLVRWITAEDNYRGRGLYDRVASRTAWVTYDIKLPS
ncbi:GNAT family N-acetyltransferase [Pseudooceanicola sediminis]|uniref:GNAT family N-acetyltransferase n=1 Tax=Pseudooceanicola sediminis TaxID=2211117 RepID=A0A399J5A7_9RHOB|nr:GNAT family N-acetyltransferase [Pseudooceanicola sediminis]KAA2317119.1 GNAT family N-acetyltransferase [Puniceibacterium sp. HSS470]RII40534.1 GNAT family N-acetyltransferase [Pseudooceanicola sediminis]|tara:strand:+ start:139352 stop:139816 length:465 start_codon:yes stop_codon:yes gene_type:complete